MEVNMQLPWDKQGSRLSVQVLLCLIYLFQLSLHSPGVAGTSVPFYR